MFILFFKAESCIIFCMAWTYYFVYDGGCFWQFERNTGKRSDDNDAWMAYSAFHLGDYKRAMEVSFFSASLCMCWGSEILCWISDSITVFWLIINVFFKGWCQCMLLINCNLLCVNSFSALTLLVGRQKEHPACKNWVMRCWRGYQPGVRYRLFAYGPADATAILKPHLLPYLNPDWFYLSGTSLPRLSWKRSH